MPLITSSPACPAAPSAPSSNFLARRWRVVVPVVVTAIAAGVVFVPPFHDPAVAAGPACSTVGIGVTSAQGTDPTFYIDDDTVPMLDSGYTGWRITNTGASARSNLWVRLADFTSTSLVLGVAPTEPNAYALGNLAPSANAMSYTYLSASGESAAPQNYVVQVWSGDPRLAGSTQLCETASRYLQVVDNIEANPNKVSGTLVGPNPPGIGGVVTLTVLGKGTGTIGSGPAVDPSVFSMSPAVLRTWPANAYKLVKSVLYIDPDGSGPLATTSYTDQLRFNNFTGGDRAYHIVYTFTTIGVTTGSTAAYPVQNIASGLPVKHTTLTDYGDPSFFPPIAPATNVTSLSLAASPTTAMVNDAIGYTVTVNAGNYGVTTADLNGDGDVLDPGESMTNSGILDNIRNVMPAGATYVAGSARWQGATIADPTVSGSTLIFNGPFSLASNTAPTLTFTLQYSTNGTKVASAYAVIGSTQIDTTLSTTDDAKATATVTIRTNSAPTIGGTASGTGDEDTSVAGTLTASDADGDTIAWSVTTPATNGIATINPTTGAWSFTPTANWSGSSTFTVTANDGFGGIATRVVNVTINPVNDPPTIAGTLAGSGPEDGGAITGTATSSDIDGGAPQWNVSAPAGNGTASINSGGMWSYTPNANFHGSDAFTIRVADGNGGFATAVVSVTVDPVNDAPIIAGDLSGSGDEDGGPITGTATSSDIDGGSPAWSIFGAQPTGGTASIDPSTGAWTFAPGADWFGSATFQIRVSDGNGGTDTETVTVDVLPTNDAPVLTGGDSGSGPEDGGAITGSLTATDIDGDTPRFALATGTSNGTFSVLANGSWTYTPNRDFFGDDEATVSVTDGTATPQQFVVHITVTPVNDDPTITGGTAATLAEDHDATGTLTSNDVDGGRPQWSVISGPTHGRLVLDPGSGEWTYTPDPDYAGGDSFDVLVSDGNGGTDAATVVLTVLAVNDDPTLAGGNSGTGDEDGGPIADTITVDDVDGGAPQFLLVTTPANAAAFEFAADGSWTFTPAADWFGSTSFDVLVSDGKGGALTVTVDITVNPINDDPVVTGGTTGNGLEDEPVDGTITIDDIDGLAQAFSVTGQPSHGTVVLDPATGGWTYTPAGNFHGVDSFDVLVDDRAGGTATATVLIDVASVNDDPSVVPPAAGGGIEDGPAVVGSISAGDPDGDTPGFAVDTPAQHGTATIDPDTGGWSYTPDADWFGGDEFVVVVSDGQGGSVTVTVMITIDPVNDDPMIGGVLSGNGPEDASAVTGQATSSDVDGGAPVWSIASPPANGSASIGASGLWSYVPAPGFSGPDQFSIEVSDGNGGRDVATVSIDISGVNDDPVIGGDLSGSGDEDAMVTGTLTATDPDGGAPEWSISSDPVNGTVSIDPDSGEWTYTPDADWFGDDSFEVTVSDGNRGTDVVTVHITIAPVNDDPLIAGTLTGNGPEEASAVVGTATSSDIDGGAPQWSIAIQPLDGIATIGADGTWRYVPASGFSGTDSFTIEVSDGNGGTDLALVEVTVSAVNDDPVIGGDLTATTDEDAAVSGTATSADPDGGVAQWSIDTLPAHGTVSIDPITGEWTYAPDADWHGTDQFDIRVTDGNGGEDIVTVVVDVLPVNDDPVVTGGLDGLGGEGTTVTGTVTATDVDDDVLEFEVSTPATNGTATIDAVTGVWTYVPATGFVGSDTFKVTVSDGQGGVTTATVTVEIVAGPLPEVRDVDVSGFLDLDGDGMRDAGEPEAGTTLELAPEQSRVANAGPALISALSDAPRTAPGPSARFTSVPVGPWIATAVATNLTAQRTPLHVVVGPGPMSASVPLVGSAVGGLSVGWDDDGDDVADRMVPGAVVRLRWYGPDGLLGTGDDLTFEVTTGSDGGWSSDHLPAGLWSVTDTASGAAASMTTIPGTSAAAAIVLSDPPVPTTATPTTVTPTVTPSVTIGPASTTTGPSTTRPLVALPSTGSDQGGILLIAFTLLALGAIAVRASRRRV